MNRRGVKAMPKKQKSGLYRTKIKIGVGADGKAINKWISGRTKAELEQARQDVIAYYITGEALKDDALFGVYAVKWFEGLKSSGLSEPHLNGYKTALNKEILPEFGDRNLRAILPSDLAEFMSRFSGMSQSKVAYTHSALRRVFEMACIDRILDRNPMEHIAHPKATPPKEKRALTLKERAAIESFCHDGWFGLFIGCLYYLGLRIGEARGLKWGDFAPGLRSVNIQRDLDENGREDTPKTKNSYRTVPVPSALAEMLRPLRGLPDVYLFRDDEGVPYKIGKIRRMWNKFMRSANITNLTPHMLRHNYITMCWENGIDAFAVSKIVGHSSVKITMDIYTHLSDAQQERAAQAIDNMFSRSGLTQARQK